MPSKEHEARRKARLKATADRARKEGKNPALTLANKANLPKPGRPKKPRPKPSAKYQKKGRGAATCGDKGGRTRDGRRCSYAAGWGTEHPGTGRCARHGGSAQPTTRSARTAHQEREITRANRRLPSDRGHTVVDKNSPKNLNDAKQLLGIPVEMNAMDALMWCIRLTAGEIVWYSDRMAELSEDQWIEDTFVGKQLHLFARNRTVSIDRLAKYSKWAVDGGIAERAMRLAEAYGEQIYQLLHGVLLDLDLSPRQRQMAPAIIARHLMTLEQKNLTNSPNELVVGKEPTDTIVVEAVEISSSEQGEGVR